MRSYIGGRKLGNAGMGLIEVMIAIAVLLTASLGFAMLLEQVKRNVVRLEQRSAIDTTFDKIKLHFFNPNTCTATLTRLPNPLYETFNPPAKYEDLQDTRSCYTLTDMGENTVNYRTTTKVLTTKITEIRTKLSYEYDFPLPDHTVFISGDKLDEAGRISFDHIYISGFDSGADDFCKTQEIGINVVFKVTNKDKTSRFETKTIPMTLKWFEHYRGGTLIDAGHKCQESQSQDFTATQKEACAAVGGTYDPATAKCQIGTSDKSLAIRLQCLNYCNEHASGEYEGTAFNVTLRNGDETMDCSCIGAYPCQCTPEPSKVLRGFHYNDSCGRPNCVGSNNICWNTSDTTDANLVLSRYSKSSSENGVSNQTQNCIYTKSAPTPCVASCGDTNAYAYGQTYSDGCGGSCTGTMCTTTYKFSHDNDCNKEGDRDWHKTCYYETFCKEVATHSLGGFVRRRASLNAPIIPV